MPRILRALTLAFSLAAAPVALAGTITTFAGGGDGIDPAPVPEQATQASLSYPRAVVVDGAGDFHFAHGGSNYAPKSIHKVSGGILTTRVASAGGVSAMAIDAVGNIYYCDATSHQVKKLDAANVVTVVAGTGTAGFGGDGGPAASAQLNAPNGIAVVGSDLLVSDSGNHRVRRISGGNITTVAGTGTSGYSGDQGAATAALISAPAGIVGDGAGGFFFTHVVPSQSSAACVRHVDAGGIITTRAPFNLPVPGAMARDAAGALYLAGGLFGHAIYRIDSGGNLTPVAGTGSPSGPLGDGGVATLALVFQPFGVAFSASGEMYIADTSNHRVRKVALNGIITTVAGGGSRPPDYVGDGATADKAVFGYPYGVSADPAGNVLVADANTPGRVRRVDAGMIISPIAGGGSSFGDGGPATSASLTSPRHAVAAGSTIYIADSLNRRIRRVDNSGTITSVAGSGSPGASNFGGDGGPATSARISDASSIAFDGSGNLYFSDSGNFRVRRITTAGVIDTVAGNGTSAASGDGALATRAGLDPRGIAFDPAGNLHIADGFGNRVRKVDANSVISTVAGNGTLGSTGDGGPATAAGLNTPFGIAFDPSGNLYIGEVNGQRVRKVSPGGIITTVAGTGTAGFSGDGGDALAATLNFPQGLAWHVPASALLIADAINKRIRKVDLADDTPAAFQFAAQTGVTVSAVVQSNTVTPTAFDVAAPVSVAGGEYSLGCTGTFTTTAGTIAPLQTVCVRHTAAAAANATTETALTIGGVKGVFASTTQPGPGSFTVLPAPLAFGEHWLNTQTGPLQVQATNTGVASMTIHAITTAAPYSVANTCAGAVVAAGASCSAVVSFRPLATGALNAMLTVQATPGTQSIALTGSGSASLTRHYYESILGRSPDSAGQAFWDGEAARIVAAGANVNEVWFALAMQFYFSAEYVARARDNAGYVTDLYLTFFDRAPDSAGLGYWSGLLSQGMPREVVLAQFMFSPEFAAFTTTIFGNRTVRAEVDMAVDFYRGLLARLPDDTGLAFWMQKFRAAQCAGGAPPTVYTVAEEVANEFIASPEYVARGRSITQFVGDLYNAFFRRGGDLEGVNFWIGRLNAGATRASLLRSFVISPEFQARVGRVLQEVCLP